MLKNSEYLNQFVQLREHCMKENNHENGMDMYNRIKNNYDEETLTKMKELK